MPSREQVAQNLETKYLKSAPKANHEKIKGVIQIYRDNTKVTRNAAEKVVFSLYLPSAFGPIPRKGKTGETDEMYADFLSRYKEDAAPAPAPAPADADAEPERPTEKRK
jgi:hypothetical protein